MATKENTGSPTQIFISYGHPEKDLCNDIVKALRARGYTPWYDEEQIHHGNDWRERITRGLKNSHAVVSCLSKHSVRDPGVCLDELSIAIGVKGSNIWTILLESETNVRPPASICHLQWLDMSRWREIKAQGEDVFRPWFNRKMEELVKVIESDESRTFAGEIETIRDRLHINYSTSKQRRLLRDHIVGREWLIRKVEDWLDNPDGERMCVLYGEPGVGKSAFAAKYIHYNPRVAAGLFCEYDRPHYNDPQTIAMTLAFLLACRLPHYRVILADILEHEKRLGELNAAELFDLLLTNPLSSMNIDGGQETLCIVIDGLDECAQGEQNALANTLFLNVPRLPKWLRVLVTSREISAVTAPLAGAFRMELRAKQEHNLDDIRAYYIEQLEERFGQEAAWGSALETLTERSGGIFQYAVLVADVILRGKMQLTEADTLPEGLAGVYHRWFGWFFPDRAEYDRVFRPALGMMLAAPEPLPSEELCRVLDWDEDQLGTFIRRISVLMQREENIFRKETLSFSHEYLSQWLGMDAAINPYACSRKTGERRMARRFYALFQKGADKLTEFEALHLTELLTSCGETGMADETVVNRDLLRRIVRVGDHCGNWGAVSLSLNCFQQARDMAEKMLWENSTYDNRRERNIVSERIAQIAEQKGDLYGALELFKRSLAVSEQLARERDTQESRRDLRVSYENVAIILYDLCDLDGALSLAQKSLGIAEQMVCEQSTLLDQRGLSRNYDNVGHILMQKGNLDSALEMHQKSMDILVQLVKEKNDPEDLRDLSLCYSSVGDILAKKGDLDGALEMHKKSLEIFEQLALEEDSPIAWADCGNGYGHIANVLRQKHNLDGALEMSQKGLEILVRLMKGRNIPQDRRNLGRMYFVIANALQQKGNLDGALELLQKILDIVKQLMQERNIPQDRKDLKSVYSYIADILEQKGDLDGALKSAKKALAISEQLAREMETPDSRHDLIGSYYGIGKYLQQKEDLDGALEMFQKCLGISKRLVQEGETPRILGEVYGLIANVLELKDDLDGALELYWKSLSIATQLVQEKNDPQDQSALGERYSHIADVLERKGDLDGALGLYRKNLEVFEQLTQEQDVPDFWRQLNRSYMRLAVILQGKGDLNGAVELCLKSQVILSRLVQGLSVEQACWNSDIDHLCVNYDYTAFILDQKGDLDGALGLYLKSLEIRKWLADAKDTPQARQNLSFCYNCVANILWRKGNLDAALDLYEKIMEIQEWLVQTEDTPQTRDTLSTNYDCMASILEKKGNLDGALELYQKSLEIRKWLARTEDTSQARQKLSFSYDYVANVLQQKGNLDGALDLLQKSLDIQEQVVQEENTPQNRHYLGTSYYNVAYILNKKGDLDKALYFYRKSSEIFEQLVQDFGSSTDKKWYQMCKSRCQELDKRRKSHYTRGTKK